MGLIGKFGLSHITDILNGNHHNHDVKEIGDRVKVIDYSSVTRINGSDIDELDEDMQFDNKMFFIVIDNKQTNRYSDNYMVYNQDIIMVNPKTKMQYRANSKHLEIVTI